MIVLGVDPGLRATGYGVVDGSRDGLSVVDFGVFRSTDDAALAQRLLEIHRHILRIVQSYQPSLLAVEDLYTARLFPRTAILVGHVRGIVCLAAAEGRIDVLALPPASAKQAITGFGAATKPQMQAAVRRLLRLGAPLNGHAADALAMAMTALSRAGYALRARSAAGGVAR